MAINVNRVIIVGRVGADPEEKGRDGGFVTLRVATSRTWRDRDGNKQEKTEWHSVTLFAEPAAKFAKNYVRKGDLVMIEGRLETREWEDKDGNKRYSTDVVVAPYDGNIQAVSKDGGGSGSRSRETDDRRERERTSSDRGARRDDIDDDIPF